VSLRPLLEFVESGGDFACFLAVALGLGLLVVAFALLFAVGLRLFDWIMLAAPLRTLRWWIQRGPWVVGLSLAASIGVALWLWWWTK
jgi:hypothetical protein